MNKSLAFLIIIFSMIGCTQNTEGNNEPENDNEPETRKGYIINEENNPENVPPPYDSIELLTLTEARQYAIDNEKSEFKFEGKKYKVKNISIDDSIFILNATSLSSESFKQNYRGKEWVGLYKNDNNNFSIKNTELKIENIFDPMLDDEGEKSGRKISSMQNGMEPFLLISGLTIDYDITNLEYTSFNRLKAGDVVEFNNYRITMQADTSEGQYAMKFFKLLIDGNKNGLEIRDTILEIDYFDDSSFSSFWVGDIDQDGLPDFILDSSHKYSYSAPTLYLSSLAGKYKLIKEASMFFLYSC